ncbi:transposase [Streptomyces sp. NPDC006739]|uniref:transposase n=1 Tax=Streptomyces sp. NPDC006739 TaxID=3364763 RepID=UPI00369870A4
MGGVGGGPGGEARPPLAHAGTSSCGVRARSQRRIFIAALSCPKHANAPVDLPPDRPSAHKTGGRRGFAWNDYRGHRLRAFIDAQDWITIHYLPLYAPRLNPVEGILSLPRRRCRAHTAFAEPDHQMRTRRQGLRQIQYRPALVDGCRVGTGPRKSS